MNKAVECVKLWRKMNPEKHAEYNRNYVKMWRAKNKEKSQAQQRITAKRFADRNAQWKSISRQFRVYFSPSLFL